MSDIPSAPNAAGAQPKKDHTALIVVLVVVGATIVLPMIFAAIAMFTVFGFVEKHIDDFKDIAKDGLSIIGDSDDADGIYMTHNETVAVRNIISQVESSTDGAIAITKRDCLYLERLASYYSEKYQIESEDTDFGGICDSEIAIHAGTEYKEADTKGASANYKLALSSMQYGCFIFNFAGNLDSFYSFMPNSTACSTMKKVEAKIVDTNEELEPVPDRQKFKIEIDDDEEEDININIKSRA